MAEDLIITGNSRDEIYHSLTPQVAALLDYETDLIANMGNFCAAVKEAFGFLWVGFYLVKELELVLGPFQGPVACTRIGFGKGVCGACWELKETIIVDDVNSFPGHIACSSASKSEIVIPLLEDGKVWAVLDVDSAIPGDFSLLDRLHLTSMLGHIRPVQIV